MIETQTDFKNDWKRRRRQASRQNDPLGNLPTVLVELTHSFTVNSELIQDMTVTVLNTGEAGWSETWPLNLIQD